MTIILQKYIAQSGFCSRRNAEDLIRNARVKVNGGIAVLGMSVSIEDIVEIDGKRLLGASQKIYIKLNKPAGYTCTNRKFKNENNIFELVPEEYAHLHVVGRLDKDSRGLVLLTNDGDLTQRMTHPSFEHEKEYLVAISNYELRITKNIVSEILRLFKEGVDIGDGDGFVKAKVVEYLEDGKFKVVLTQGSKRQIRRMFGVFGLEVSDLFRVRIGRLELGNLEEGKWEEVDKKILV